MNRVCICYFSPCHNVEKIVTTIGLELSKKLCCESVFIDFTLPKNREQTINFNKDDIVVLGTPVYAGRVPNKIMPFIKESIKGNGALGISIVSFGNRSFDDALAELFALMKNNNFNIIGAAAIVSEHSFVKELATARPNKTDIDELKRFADSLADKLNDKSFICIDNVDGDEHSKKYYQPLKEDLSPAIFLKAVSKLDNIKCNNCGICSSVCPMGSISPISHICEGICIKCQACIHECKSNARYFDNEDFLSHIKMLKNNHIDYKQSKYYK